MNTHLISKYDTAAPRYTSYPTVPYWKEATMDTGQWLTLVKQAAKTNEAISLYIHLPFCESLCTYCGCNKHITKNHGVEHPYIKAVLKEWEMYRAVLPTRPLLRELHLGGGTPTFFSPESLSELLTGILEGVDVTPDADFGFEAHPWSTTPEHLKTLAGFGFRRISIGVQDFDEDLMRLVNRSQTVESVIRCTENARAMGYKSINYDLIYGLPKQTAAHIERDADFLEQLRPDRIAFYSYAHVPWIKGSQRAYDEGDLPTGAAKRLLYETGRARLDAMGYREIGMDHFALPHDGLARAMDEGSLHRNFMGYTTAHTPLLIGLGASAIGDTGNAFAQNEKTIAAYQQSIAEDRLPVFRGHFLNDEDEMLRRHILNLMTRFATSWASQHEALEAAVERLEPLQKDGLVRLTPFHVQVTEAGIPFLRNICMAFDAHYWRKQPEGKLFSQAV